MVDDKACSYVTLDHVLPRPIRQMPVCHDMTTSCRPPQRRGNFLPLHDAVGAKSNRVAAHAVTHTWCSTVSILRDNT